MMTLEINFPLPRKMTQVAFVKRVKKDLRLPNSTSNSVFKTMNKVNLECPALKCHMNK